MFGLGASAANPSPGIAAGQKMAPPAIASQAQMVGFIVGSLLRKSRFGPASVST